MFPRHFITSHDVDIFMQLVSRIIFRLVECVYIYIFFLVFLDILDFSFSPLRTH